MSIKIIKKISEKEILKAIENKDIIRKSDGKPNEFWKSLVVLDIIGYDIVSIKNSTKANKLIEKEKKETKNFLIMLIIILNKKERKQNVFNFNSRK
ncbi:MAG: hypothetical protein K9K32_00085 [Halanaerobiales bacterium]|nr:hypothetical protein [Halanaerobiales bacterium]